jgi:hypothetical protein
MIDILALWFWVASQMLAHQSGTIIVPAETAIQIEADQRRWLEMTAAEQVAESGKYYGAELKLF